MFRSGSSGKISLKYLTPVATMPAFGFQKGRNDV